MNILANQISFIEQIKDFINQFKKPVFRQSYRVSGAHDYCTREWVLSTIIQDPEFTQSNWVEWLRMEMGTALHKQLQNMLLGPAQVLWGEWECINCKNVVVGYMPKEVCDCSNKCINACIWPDNKSKRICQLCPVYGRYNYIEPTIECDFSGKYKLKGQVDGIVISNNERLVLEIKTIGPKYFTMLNAPYNHHIIQANLYMYFLKIPQAIMLYVDRSLEILPIFKEYYITLDESLALSVLNTIRNGDLLLLNIDQMTFDKLPVRLCSGINDFRAKRCPYRDKCFDDIYLIKFFKGNIGGANANRTAG